MGRFWSPLPPSASQVGGGGLPSDHPSLGGSDGKRGIFRQDLVAFFLPPPYGVILLKDFQKIPWIFPFDSRTFFSF